jgi:hypothetical protein
MRRRAALLKSDAIARRAAAGALDAIGQQQNEATKGRGRKSCFDY